MVVGGEGGLIQLFKPKFSPKSIVFPFMKETNVKFILTSSSKKCCDYFSKLHD
jgi:hypothetical protein